MNKYLFVACLLLLSACSAADDSFVTSFCSDQSDTELCLDFMDGCLELLPASECADEYELAIQPPHNFLPETCAPSDHRVQCLDWDYSAGELQMVLSHRFEQELSIGELSSEYGSCSTVSVPVSEQATVSCTLSLGELTESQQVVLSGRINTPGMTGSLDIHLRLQP